ncbi:MAG: 6-carboxytetrahydropterin synthase QueD [Deltaproteobacteria bacterium]|nr:6-carboxytetrahydropterin synthase QueD [Deltaproteobacteria bacterium]
MSELGVKVDFAAAHHIVGYPGDCSRQHGHNWVIEVFARSETLDKLGLAMDFRELKNLVKELIASWDHQDLNTLKDFKAVNPTAEVIAKLMHEKLSEHIKGRSIWIDRVSVWENDRCSATYLVVCK